MTLDGFPIKILTFALIMMHLHLHKNNITPKSVLRRGNVLTSPYCKNDVTCQGKNIIYGTEAIQHCATKALCCYPLHKLDFF